MEEPVPFTEPLVLEHPVAGFVWLNVYDPRYHKGMQALKRRLGLWTNMVIERQITHKIKGIIVLAVPKDLLPYAELEMKRDRFYDEAGTELTEDEAVQRPTVWLDRASPLMDAIVRLGAPLLSMHAPLYDVQCRQLGDGTTLVQINQTLLQSGKAQRKLDDQRTRSLMSDPSVYRPVKALYDCRHYEDTTDYGPSLPDPQKDRPLADPSDSSDGCCICFVNQANTILLPCGHMQTCRNCSEPLTLCPACSSEVETREFHLPPPQPPIAIGAGEFLFAPC